MIMQFKQIDNYMKKYIYIILLLSIYFILEFLTQEYISIWDFSIAKVIDLSYAFLFFVFVDTLLESRGKLDINKYLFYGICIFLFILIFVLSRFFLLIFLSNEIHFYLNSNLYISIFLLMCLYFTFKFYNW
jgi:hypothetical protein